MKRAITLAVVIAAVVTTAVALRKAHSRDPLSDAMRAMPYRFNEARFGGDDSYWPPPPSTDALQNDRSPLALRLRRAAGEAIADPDPHRTAIAHLILGDSSAAIAALQHKSTQREASRWSDLSASLLIRSEKMDDPGFAAEALNAADHALAIDRHCAAASFNRALALTRLGLIIDARHAWLESIDLDHDSRWSDEALHRLHSLGIGNEAREWSRIQQSIDRNVGNRDALIRRAILQCPENLRRWAENIALTDWADAIQCGDAKTATARVDVARAAGDQLAKQSGETLLRDSVATIDRAAPRTAIELASAYRMYRDGRIAHMRNRPVEAEGLLREARDIFTRLGSPAAYAATYYLGSALHAQTRLPEAATILDALAAERLETRGYRSMSAQIGWERGSCLMERGAISDAIDTFTQSRAGVERLRERNLIASMDSLLAYALDCAGDMRAAWLARRRAFENLARAGNDVSTLVVIASSASTAATAKRWDIAEPMLALAIGRAADSKNALVAAHCYVELAFMDVDRRDVAAAKRAIASSRSWSKQLADPGIRARCDADIATAEAMVMRSSDPNMAVARFDDAIAYYERGERLVQIPQIYLERARTLQALGRIADARRDIDSGLAIVDSMRGHLRENEQRASFMATAEAIFEEGIDLAVRSHDYESAFTMAERQRARALTDMFELGEQSTTASVTPMPLQAIREAVAPDAAIIEYIVLRDRLVVFVVKRDAFVAREIAATPAELQSAIARLRTTSDLAAAATADDLLLKPVRDDLVGIVHVAFVPDASVIDAPFGALFDRTAQSFLIERADVVVAPSATLLISASRRAASPVDLSVLAIGASVVDAQRYRDAPPLANAENESNAIATLYPRHTVVSGVEATCDRVRSLIADFAVVHFAAHTARNDERVSQSALLLAPSPADHGELRLGEIASRRMAKTRLVVLAACSSAVADRRSDGAESLASAFIAAGVPTVVATLADVDDAATSRVMEAFHERFRASRAAASSARSAIRSEIRDSSGRIRIPLRWSSFTVVGGSSEFAINERVVPAVRAPRPPTAISDRSISSHSTPRPLADAVRVSRGSMRD